MNQHVNRRDLLAASAALSATIGTEAGAAIRANTLECLIRDYQAAFDAQGEVLERQDIALSELGAFKVEVTSPPYEFNRGGRVLGSEEEIIDLTEADWFEAENSEMPLQQERRRLRLDARAHMLAEFSRRKAEYSALAERLEIGRLNADSDQAWKREQAARLAIITYRPNNAFEAERKRDFITNSVFYEDEWCETEEDFCRNLLMRLCEVDLVAAMAAQ